MNVKRQNSQENGQIIVLLAISLVFLLIVAALAIDGGMIYSERRNAQNVADAASFAGGGEILNSGKLDIEFSCPSSSSYISESDSFANLENIIAMAVNAARTRAVDNNISSLPYLGYQKNGVLREDFGLNANHGVWVDCNDGTFPKTIDIVVRITSQVETSFAQLIYQGPLQTTNEAVVTVEQQKNTMYGDAIISLSPDCTDDGDDGGLLLHNNNLDITIVNGGAFSNSCLSVKNQSNSSINIDRKFNIVGNITGTHPDQLIIVDNTNTGQTPLPENFPNPTNPKSACSGLIERDYEGEEILYPGYYPDGITIQNQNDHFFMPGLYCIDNEFDIRGGSLTGLNVTFFIFDGTSIKNNGNADVKFVAPTLTTDPYYGLLFYIEGNNGSLDWNGTNDSHYNGLVYAPQRNIDFSGNSNNSGGTCPEIDDFSCEGISYPTQIVGYQITFAGNSTINITNPENGAFSFTGKLYLKK